MGPRRVDLGVAVDAERALAGIAAGKAVPPEVLTRLKGLPVLLRTSGVAATLAFFAAKSGADDLGQAYRKVRAALVAQLCAVLGWQSPPADLYQQLASLAPADLGRIFVRLEAFAGWLRRLAESVEQEQEQERGRQQTTSTRDANAPVVGDGGAGDG